MLTSHNCPRCRLPVAEERLNIMPFVCDHCGHTLATENTNISIEKSDSRKMIGGAVIGVLLFIAAASNVEMRWLQTRDFLGLSSLKSLERLVQVCTQLHQSQCVEKALASQARKDPRRTAAYGEYLMMKLKYKEAAQSMKKYVAGGQADARTLAAYGKALAELGQIDEAARHFERALSVRAPSMDHVQTYVRYLTRAKRFDQALGVILRARRTNYNALPVEYRVISEMRGHANNRVTASRR